MMYDFVQVVENVIYFYRKNILRLAIVTLDNGRYVTVNLGGCVVSDNLLNL